MGLAALTSMMGVPTALPAAHTPEEIAAQQAQVDLLKDRTLALAELAKKDADLKKQVAAEEEGKKHADAMRKEREAVDRLRDSAIAGAAAQEILARSTGKGTAISIEAAAAAENERKNIELAAEMKRIATDAKLSPRDIAENEAYRQANAELTRQAQLRDQVGKATETLGKKIDDFAEQSKNLLATLDAQAAGHSKVSREQQEQLNKLDELKRSLAEAKKAYDTLAEGPEKKLAGADLAAKEGVIAGLETQTRGTVLPRMAAVAFDEELQKVREHLKEAADPSPWEKTQVKIDELARTAGEYRGQIEKIGAAMHAADTAGEFQKLINRAQELAIVSAELATASPYATIAGEVAKLAAGFHYSATEAAAVRAELIAIQQQEEINKGFAAADALNAGGSRMLALRQQLAGLGQFRSLDPNAMAAVQLEMQNIREEMDKIALKTGDAEAGFQAWLDTLRVVESEGQFVFNELSQASKGAEDNAAKTLVDIVENYHRSHTKLIKELESMWERFFGGLMEKAVSHGLDKLVAGIPGLGPKAQPAGIPGLAGGPPLVGGQIAQSSNVTALTANTQALIALTAKISAGGGGLGVLGLGSGAGAGAAAAAPDISDLPSFTNAASAMSFPMMAEGGFASPGSTFISGEAGAEEVTLGTDGGARITPLGVKTGGDTTHYYDMRGAVVTDDLIRKADAAQMMSATEQRSVARAVSMSQDIARRGGTPTR